MSFDWLLIWFMFSIALINPLLKLVLHDDKNNKRETKQSIFFFQNSINLSKCITYKITKASENSFTSE